MIMVRKTSKHGVIKVAPNKYIGTREDVIGTTTLTTKGNKQHLIIGYI